MRFKKQKAERGRDATGFISKTEGGNVQQVRFACAAVSLRITGFLFVHVESVATVSLGARRIAAQSERYAA